MTFSVRAARTSDVPFIQALVEPLVQRRILLGKDSVVFYEAIQEFRIAEDETGNVIGCGALHVIWQDLAEVRTLAVIDEWLHRGVGHALMEQLEADARDLGLSRLEEPIDPAVYLELVRSPDEGVAEFLDLARVKPNTLGNTRMIKRL
jgi:amino-acid N-acetyltransferase